MNWRLFASLTLALVLVLTSHAMATARGAAAATGQMVICTGDGTITVYTDASGIPVSAPHLCPDCVVVDTFAAPPLHPMPVDHARLADLYINAVQTPSQSAIYVGWHSRAPPLTV